ncbi:MAG: glucosaminidase domain-containing protein [Bacteroidetes bacterium]|nr:glucosaminidase domain-containing protein [Bacteroidota bacterium]
MFTIQHSIPFIIKKGYFLLIFCSLNLISQTDSLISLYIKQNYQIAKEQMLIYQIPASITLAQAILESAAGTSELAKRSNNHFGIKCHLQWQGDTVRKTDDTLNECFRKYENFKDSYTDHSRFIKSRPRYIGLFYLGITNYKAWCLGLKQFGYATHKKYSEDLIAIIQRFKLYEFDASEPLNNKLESIDKEKHLIPSFAYSFNKIKFDNSNVGCLFVSEFEILPANIELVTQDKHIYNYLAN